MWKKLFEIQKDIGRYDLQQEKSLVKNEVKELLPCGNVYQNEEFVAKYETNLQNERREKLAEAARGYTDMFDRRERERVRCIVKDYDCEIGKNIKKLVKKQNIRKNNLIKQLQKQNIKYEQKVQQSVVQRKQVQSVCQQKCYPLSCLIYNMELK